MVSECYTTDLDVVFRGNDDFCVRFDRVVSPPVFGTCLHEDCLVVIGTAQGRLMRGRPIPSTIAVTQVNEGAPVIRGGILAPTGDGEVTPAAVTAAGMSRHNVVVAVR